MENLNIDPYLEALQLEAIRATPIQHEETLSSAVYKLVLSNQKSAILKICYNEDRFRRELFFLNHLQSHFPAPKVLGSVKPSNKLQGAILMEFLPGALLSESKLTDEMAYKMGALLASLHSLGAKKYGDLSIENEAPSDPIRELKIDFEESFAECEKILTPALLSKARRYFESHLPIGIKLDGPCIVHRDYKPGNLFVENGEIVGVIDWELARGSFSGEDFVRMDHLVWAKDEKSKKPFLEGYQSVRPLPAVDELLPLLRIARALGAIGFTVRRNSWNSKHKAIFEANKSYLEERLS